MILAFLRTVGGVLAAIPWRVWVILGCVTALVVIHLRLVHVAVAQNETKWEAKMTEQRKALEAKKAEQAKVTLQVVTEYRDRVKVVKEKGDEVVKLVTVYVPAGLILPSGWRVLHDAAASGVVPESPERALGESTAVDSATAISTVAKNYKTANACRIQLLALQKWAVEVSKGTP